MTKAENQRQSAPDGMIPSGALSVRLSLYAVLE